MMRVEVDHDQYGVAHGGPGNPLRDAPAAAHRGLEAYRFAVGEKMVVVDVMESETAVALQWCVFPADAIQPCNELPEAVLTVPRPLTDLVLLRRQILLAAGLDRPVLGELERRSVDPVTGPQ